MRTLIYGSVMICLSGLSLFILFVFCGRVGKNSEFERDAFAFTKYALECGMAQNADMAWIDREFWKGTVQRFFSGRDGGSEYEVQVMGADFRQGYLSLRLVRQFCGPGGDNRKIAAERTALLDGNIRFVCADYVWRPEAEGGISADSPFRKKAGYSTVSQGFINLKNNVPSAVFSGLYE